MLTSQAFRDYFPSCLSLPPLKAVGALLKDSPCSFFPWWLCNRPELLAQPPTMGSSLKSAAWLPLPWTRRRPLATRDITHSTRTGNSPSFHPDVSHPKFCLASVLPYLDVSQSQFCPADIPPSPNVSHPAPTAG